MAETFYKVTYDDGTPCHGGVGRWSLPSGDAPGAWMSPVPVISCTSGYHLCTADQLVNWLHGERTTVWVAEGRGDRVDAGDKVVFAEARLVRPALTGMDQLLLASDFAAHVARFTRDVRVPAAIQATRAYAHGRIDWATCDVARNVAGAANLTTLQDAVHDAALAAALAATRDAWDVAWGKERKWQRHLVRAVLAGRRKPGTVRITKAKEADSG